MTKAGSTDSTSISCGAWTVIGCSKEPLISLRSSVALSISGVSRFTRELGPLTETATVEGSPTATWSGPTPSIDNGSSRLLCVVVVLLLVTNSHSNKAMPTAASLVGQFRARRPRMALRVAQAPVSYTHLRAHE